MARRRGPPPLLFSSLPLHCLLFCSSCLLRFIGCKKERERERKMQEKVFFFFPICNDSV